MQIKIFHENWKVLLKSDKDFDQQHGENIEGEVLFDKKLICLRSSGTTKNIIKHEIAHALHSYMIVLDLSLDANQYEEFLCEFISKYSDYINQLTNEVYKKICQ